MNVMTSSRDDFTDATKTILAKRVGTVCSNPTCATPTFGPNHNPHKATSKGVAAHLTAAAPNGPRYDPSLTPEQRRDANNGIWLCQNCARMIDVDEAQYSLDTLRLWKIKAEERARRALENPSLINAPIMRKQLFLQLFNVSRFGSNRQRVFIFRRVMWRINQ